MIIYDLMTYCLTNMGIHRVALQWFPSFLHRYGQKMALGEEML